MKFCQVCDLFSVKFEVSYLEVSEDRIECCEGCFEDHYQGDEDIKEIVLVG